MERRNKQMVRKLILIQMLLLMICTSVYAQNTKLWKTGQTTTYQNYDDGYYSNRGQGGVNWSSSRFTENDDGTITDSLTGLMWAEDASTPTVGSCTGGRRSWQQALDYVKCLNNNNYLGYSDWRLPNRKELVSLIDSSMYNPALPNGHPFSGVQSWYWSSTSYDAVYTDVVWFVVSVDYGHAWNVNMDHGSVSYVPKGFDGGYAWPVRP